MRAFVVDTNAPVVSNGRSSQADPACVTACIQALIEVRQAGIIVLDDKLLILEEYMSNLSMSGQPGPGDLFMKWVWTNQANPNHCKQVAITPRADDPTNFIEFPNDPDLTGFDRSDRKFVAVALASGDAPEVLNAVDSDWADHFTALTRNGIRLRFLCPQFISPRS
jgi:hypothetical protein